MTQPLTQSCGDERAPSWSVLQTAQPTERLLFGRHNKSAGLIVSGLSPRGDGDAWPLDRQAHRQTGLLGELESDTSSPCGLLVPTTGQGPLAHGSPALGPRAD